LKKTFLCVKEGSCSAHGDSGCRFRNESERARSTHAVTAAMFRRKTGKADTIAICQVVFSF
jgi:hypothetical protein